MQTEQYRESLKGALKNLIKVNESLFDSVVPLSMQGDLKEWNDLVPIGEVHQFDFEIFKNSSDTNIQLLVKLMDKVDATYEHIKNINGIEIED